MESDPAMARNYHRFGEMTGVAKDHSHPLIVYQGMEH